MPLIAMPALTCGCDRAIAVRCPPADHPESTIPRLEKIDAIALARSVSEIEMVRIASAQYCGTLLPAGNDVGASSHGKAIVEPEVKLLLAHCAPVRRVKRRGHAQFSLSRCVAARFHLAGKCSTRLQSHSGTAT